MFTGVLVSLVFVTIYHALVGNGKCQIDNSVPRPCLQPNCYLAKDIQFGFLLLKLRKRNHITDVSRVTKRYLFLLLLSLSADVEQNPGPVDYPCGTCGTDVLDSDPAILCDSCNTWFHIQCESITQSYYSDLVKCNQSFTWYCTNCDTTNFSVHSNASLSSIVSNNSFSVLSSSAYDSEIEPHPPARPIENKKNYFSGLKTLTINCQSIVNKKLDFQTLIETENPDIVFGTESWLTPSHTDNEIFPPSLGYTPFRQDRKTGKSGGGVFILVKNSIVVSEMKRLNTNCEIIWLKIELVGAQPLYIASYYRPHEQDEDSLLEFYKSLEMVTKLKGKIWIAGDFNFPKLSWDPEGTPSMKPGCSHPKVYEYFLSIINDFSLQQMVSLPTRLNNTLDLFLTSNPTLVKHVSTMGGIADHDIVKVHSEVKPRLNIQKPRIVPLYKKADWLKFQQFIDEKSPSLFQGYNTRSVEDLWSEFKALLQEGMNLFIPTKRISSRPSLPWITQSIKRQIRKRNKLFQKVKTNPTQKVKQHYKNFKNLVRKNIKLAHDSYIEYILDSQTGQHDDADSQLTGQNFSSKKLFSLLKHAKQDSQGIAPLLEEGYLHTDDKTKANILNRQFQSVFTPMSPLKLGQLCKMKVQSLLSFPKGYQIKYPLMPQVTIGVKGVEKLLSSLKVDKACGPDNIKPILLKNLSVQISPLVTKLFQRSLDTGTIPADWSKANVTPLFKKGDKGNPANYRPISLTCILCKLLEHIIASNITKHFQVNNILYDLQHGFRERRSCETQLLELVDDLSRNLLLGHQTDLILLDFSKAFDKVNHLKLLYKLHQHGVQGATLQWVKSFLIGRRQSVLVNGETSDEVPVTSGVPQGSVLGPLLFLLYINDLPENLISQVRLFADDTAVYITVNNAAQEEILQQDLNRLQLWEEMWDMEFNPSKCTVMNITRSKSPFKSRYMLHGQILETVNDAKYLGVTISSDLNWNKHVNLVTSKATRTLNFIKRNIPCKNPKVREFAYKALVRPQLEYSSSVWSPYTQQNINHIEMIQRRAARWVNHDYSSYSSVTSMIRQLGWRTLQDRRSDARLTMFYKIVNGLVAIPMPSYVKSPVRLSRHMHPLSYTQIQTPCNYYKYSFFPATIILWNSLPADLVEAPTLHQFKQGVSKFNYKA